MQREHGFGIIGGGAIAHIHAKEINGLPGARLVAFASGSKHSAGRLAQDYNIDWHEDYRDLLARPDVAIVTICTPSGTHGEIAIEAARAGKHVIVEKPMDISLDAADRMIAEALHNQVKLSVVSQHRFDASIVKLKQILQSSDMGDIVLAEAAVHWYRNQQYYDSSHWRGTWKLDGGGALINQSIHTVDMLIHLLGPVHRVHAIMKTAAHKRIEVEDVLTANVEFRNGALCTISCTTAAYPGFPNRIELFGTKGSTILVNDTLTHYYLKDRGEVNLAADGAQEDEMSQLGGYSDPIAISGFSHRTQFADMIAAITENREPLISGAEGRRTLELVLAMYKSAIEGTTITLHE